MQYLEHNGIIVLDPPNLPEFTIVIKDQEVRLTQHQAEMAYAWAKKVGTPYVEDPVFNANFMIDFSKALGIDNPQLQIDDVDFTPVIEFVEAERARKQEMTKEEKRAAREARKAKREELKEKYGYALVDGERMELGNYQTEPSGIFMGRGKHPLRGRWKQGATHSDIVLNMHPDASRPEGDWKDIVWAPDTMWVAKWRDELTGRDKYVWLHDSTPIKQEREAAKFDKALKIGRKMDDIRQHIKDGLHSSKPRRRMIAAACYLIDRLNLRVGDEKEKDEADTVGATTLRVEHLTFTRDAIVLDFLGKDSVPWHKELELEPDVYTVFRELYNRAVERMKSFESRKSKKTSADSKRVSQLFLGIGSSHVNRFLGELDSELTAKMFRTHHASVRMKKELTAQKTRKKDPDFIKKVAFKRANLEVAKLMNHSKKQPKGWPKRVNRNKERIQRVDARITKAKKRLAKARKRLRARKKKEKKSIAKKHELVKKRKAITEKHWSSVLSWREKRDLAKESWDRARELRRKTRQSKRKGKTTKKERMAKRQERVAKTRERLDMAEERLAKARDRYRKSKERLKKTKESLKAFRERSQKRIESAERSVERAKGSVKKAKLAKRKIQDKYALARDARTWNLGTSLKSYIHPKIVYNWCKRVDYDWKKLYPKALRRKFSWIEDS